MKDSGNDWPEWKIRRIFMKPGKEWTDEEKAVAFEYFIKKYLNELIQTAYGFIHRGISNSDKAFFLAEDVVNEKLKDAFLFLHTYDPHRYPKFNELYKKIKEKAGERAFKSWVFDITIKRAVYISKIENRMENLLNGLKEREDQGNREISELIPRLESEDTDQGIIDIDRLELKDIWESIEPYLTLLSPKSSEALRLVQGQRLSHADAGKNSKYPCNANAMKKRLFIARQKLDTIIKKHKTINDNIEKFLNGLPLPLRQAYILIIKRKKMIHEAALIAKVTLEEMMKRLKQVIIELKKFLSIYPEEGEILEEEIERLKQVIKKFKGIDSEGGEILCEI